MPSSPPSPCAAIKLETAGWSNERGCLPSFCRVFCFGIKWFVTVKGLILRAKLCRQGLYRLGCDRWQRCIPTVVKLSRQFVKVTQIADSIIRIDRFYHRLLFSFDSCNYYTRDSEISSYLSRWTYVSSKTDANLRRRSTEIGRFLSVQWSGLYRQPTNVAGDSMPVCTGL